MTKKPNLMQKVFNLIRAKPTNQWTIEEENQILNLIDTTKLKDAINNYKIKTKHKYEN